MLKTTSGVVIGMILLTQSASAQDTSSYWLFNPTPDESLRDFNTDRPGKTHSTSTVDAGHVQFESDIFNYTYDRDSRDDTTRRGLVVAAPLVKLGITDEIDLEAGFSLYNDLHAKDRSTGATANGEGFGDIEVGSKINIWGNDGKGESSFALLPFVKLPVASREVGNGRAEYALNLPYNFKLYGPWSLTLEPGIGLLRNDDNDKLHGDYNFAANLNRPVSDKVTVALELANDFPAEAHSASQLTLDPSVQWLVTPTLQLDVGAYIGLTKASPDLDAYTGFSVRF